MKTNRTLIVGLLALSGLAFPALATLAQPEAAPAAAPAPEAPAKPTWTDAEFEKIAGQLAGHWKSSSPLKQRGSTESAVVVLHITPVVLDGVTDAFYAEMSREDSMHRPYRFAMLQLYRHKGAIRLRTFELINNTGKALTGMWAVPEVFPRFKAEDLRATLDVELKAAGSGYAGKTPYPYPTSTLGAVEMTSDVAFDGTNLSIEDRGFDASGNVVWGASADEKLAFTRFEPSVSVARSAGGTISIEYVKGTEPLAAKDDKATTHYAGFLSNGSQFDSSFDRGQPAPFPLTDGQLIPGFIDGLVGAGQGSIRRIIIPSSQAYGEMGRPPVIPGNSNLYFETEVMLVEKAVPPAAPTPSPEAAPAENAAPASEQPKPSEAGDK